MNCNSFLFTTLLSAVIKWDNNRSQTLYLERCKHLLICKILIQALSIQKLFNPCSRYYFFLFLLNQHKHQSVEVGIGTTTTYLNLVFQHTWRISNWVIQNYLDRWLFMEGQNIVMKRYLDYFLTQTSTHACIDITSSHLPFKTRNTFVFPYGYDARESSIKYINQIISNVRGLLCNCIYFY